MEPLDRLMGVHIRKVQETVASLWDFGDDWKGGGGVLTWLDRLIVESPLSDRHIFDEGWGTSTDSLTGEKIDK